MSYIIKSSLPLLLSGSELEKWGAIQDYKNSTLTINGEIIKLNKMESGHYGLDLGKTEEIQRCYVVDEKFQTNKSYQMKEIEKLHKVMGHPGADKLIDLFRNRGGLSKGVIEIINQCYAKCHVCRKHS